MHISGLGRIVPFLFPFLILSGCGGIQLKNTNTLSIAPGSIAFGNTTVGQTATSTVALQNRGLAAVELSQLTTGSTAFAAVSNSLPVTIAPGATYNLTVKFSPAAAG